MARKIVTSNDWLPCAEEGRAEAARHIPKIVQGILDGAAKRDWHHLMRKSVHGLKRYLNHKYALPLADRAMLATTLYRVVTQEATLDQYLQKLFTQQLIRLLKRKAHEKLEIELEWRPLFRIIDMLFFGKARIPQTPLCPYLGYYLVSLARIARHYFAAGSPEEIMLEMSPLFCAQHTGSLLKGQVLLTLLLPRAPVPDLNLVREVMSMWGWVVAYADWDLHWMVLVSSVCRHTYLTIPERWEQFVPQLFSHVLHIIDLPVGASKMHIYANTDNSVGSPEGSPFFSLASFVHLTGNRSKLLQVVHKAAKLIIYLLRPGGGVAFTMLARIIKAVETYLHPSNGGYWTHRLAQLLASLCEYVSERVRSEKALPEGHASKLTEADKEAVAGLVLPLAMQALYSKSGTTTLQACIALKYLGFLAPTTTLQPLLVRVYQALTTLTEVHQTSAALEAMAAVIYPIIRADNFGAGVRHVADLMELTLTGIDANDLPKTWATLRFHTVLLSGLPLIPLPETCPEGCDRERHEIARLASDSFGDWAFRFLDQTFTFIANHNSMAPAPGGEPKKSDADTRTSEYFFHCTLEVFFAQLGDELYASALNKVANYCFTNLLLQQQQAQLGVVVSAMTAVQPDMTVKKFIPMCLRILLVSPSDRSPRTPSFTRSGNRTSSSTSHCVSPTLPQILKFTTSPSQSRESSGNVGEGGGEELSGGFKLALLSEMELVYYLNLMRYVADNAGGALVPYKEQIMSAIDLSLKVEERAGVLSLQVFKAANKLVRALLHSLVTCRPKECRSVPPTTWNDPEWKKRHYESWGHVIDMASADITWHTPSEAGLHWAANLAARYIRSPLAVLERYAAATAMSSLDERTAAPRAPGEAGEAAAETNGLDAHAHPSDHSMLVDEATSKDGGAESVSACAQVVHVGRRGHGEDDKHVGHGEVGEGDAMLVEPGQVSLLSLDGQVMSPSTGAAGRARIHKEQEVAEASCTGSGGKRPIDLEVHVLHRADHAPAAAHRPFGTRRKLGGVSATEARFAVLQVRYVLEGMVAAMPCAQDSGDNEKAADSDDEMAMDEDDQGIASNEHEDLAGAEVYCSGTYQLPLPSVDTSSAMRWGTDEEGCEVEHRRISELMRQLVRISLGQNSEDSKMLKALAKCVDVCVNGVDILQKQTRRLRLRYSIMKARNREVAADGHTKLLARYMVIVKLHHHYLSRVMIRRRKVVSSPFSNSMLKYVSALSVNEHSGVRARGQVALLSFCRRYRGASASALPTLITILADRKVEAAGHEQRICGACVLLGTRYFQGRILRDWRMMQHFLITLCSSFHNDKESVLDSLDGLFATFLSYWYQVSLDSPGYMAWKGGLCAGKTWPRASVPFDGYGSMLEVLVKLLKTAAHMHWRFKLMIIDAVTVMIRDDVATPMAVWEAMFDGMVSENSHIREACVPALSSALELMQDRQQSKEDRDGGQARFPDKAFHHWNGPPPKVYLNKCSFDARKRVASAEYKHAVSGEGKDPLEYKHAVRTLVERYFSDTQYLEKLIKVMSVVQLGRSKHMNGSHAQMFKGLLKAFGPSIIAPLQMQLDAWLENPQAKAQSRESSDVYIGQQCFAAELVAGLVRGSKYWHADDHAVMRAIVAKVLRHVLSNAEMETVSIWATCLRFCLFDRHPRHTRWLTELIMDNAIPASAELGTTCVLVCKKLLLLKTVVKEVGWRGAPLQRQLAHDIEPFLDHPFAQMRSCVGAIMATLARVSWDPALHGNLPGALAHDHPAALEPCLKQPHSMEVEDDAPASRACLLLPSRTVHRGDVESRQTHVESGRTAHIADDTSRIPLAKGSYGSCTASCTASETIYRLVDKSARHAARLSMLYRAEKESADNIEKDKSGAPEATATCPPLPNPLLPPAAAGGGAAGGGGGGGAGGDEEGRDEEMGGKEAHAAHAQPGEAEAAAAAGCVVTTTSKGDKKVYTTRDQLRHLRHTLITCICSMCPDFDGMYRCPVEAYLPVLLPPLLAALEDRDPDISRQARGCAELTANTPLLAQVLPGVLDSVRSVSKSKSWQVRSSVLPFLQVMVFRHQCCIAPADMEMVRELILSLLLDHQVEVREMASAAVAVLVRICGEELALQLKCDFAVWATQPLLPPSKASGVKEEEDERRRREREAVQRRHAGVLGMAALIGAYPYDVPPWMPQVLVELAQHVIDPMPIKQTVRNTFGEFWRTHQDTWPMLKDKFREEELGALTTLLASPSYFS